VFLRINKRITPAQIIILGFLGIILMGAALLMLPIATRGSGGASLLEALFTATSATCVTGLVVQDTALYWSPFGQLVILLLIQVGGMGVITLAITVAMVAGKKIGLKQRWVMQESIAAPQVGGIVRMTGFIIRAVLLIEGAGALLLAFSFCPTFGLLRGLWYAVFHSVSAFCNAGFDLMGVSQPFSSLTAYTSDPLINGTVMVLIVLGGIGFLTWDDLWVHRHHLQAYRLQSKLILVTTLLLLVGAFLFLFLYEFNQNTWQGLSLGERVQAAMFQAVTPRTAGFNTVDIARMSEPSLLFLIVLMLTGGSPGSTAGGYKTTTLAVLLLSAWAVISRKAHTQCFGRRLPDDTLRRAVTIFLLYLVCFLTGGMLICCIDGVALMKAMFEAASAIGTVGLSLGITSGLSSPSQLILIFLMYLGRVGSLTLIFALASHEHLSAAKFPQERLIIG
jgi:trk system potassium uptake protein TrkH